MELLPADWAFAGLAAVLSVLGLFRGFSGALAFLAATAAAAAAAVWAWPLLAERDIAMWLRVVAETAGATLVFGIVRICVKKAVNGLLAQPVDSIAGFAAGLACAALALLAASRLPAVVERSALAREVAAHVW